MTNAAMRRRSRGCVPAEEFESLEQAARSRSEADWIVGMNATRAATIRLRSSFDGAVSLGRVQTPTLAIIARREEEIRAFMPEPYWLVDATFVPDANGDERVYAGRYHAGAKPRIATEAEARRHRRGLPRRAGTITKLEKKEQSERAPMLYDLTSLQRDANTRFGFSARRTLAAAQRLYEEHKALTYPRTSSRYLTTDMVPEIKPIAELVGARQGVRTGRRVRARASTCSRSRASSTTQGRRPPRDHPDQLGGPAPGRQDERRRPPRLRHGRAALPGRLPSRRRVREHARRDDGAGTRRRRRPATSSARAASCCSSPAGAASTASCPRARHAPTRTTRAPSSSCRASSRASRRASATSAASARRPSRRGATPTPRCSARWRRPASSSTTTSCARR